MRLTNHVQTTARHLFSNGVRIWLFGSHTDNDQRGGDIDLYLETDVSLENRVEASCRFAAELQMQLGEQKIDVLLVEPNTPHHPIHRIALKTGIRL